MEVGVPYQVVHVRFITHATRLNIRAVTPHESRTTSVAVPCGDPPTIPNGSRTFTGTTFGGTATYTCNTGYQRSGPFTVTCQSSRSWSTRPTCLGIRQAISMSNCMHHQLGSHMHYILFDTSCSIIYCKVSIIIDL